MPDHAGEIQPLRTKIRVIITHLMPMCVIIFMVIGLILLGVATPTESAAFGVLGVLVVAAGFRGLSWAAIYKISAGYAEGNRHGVADCYRIFNFLAAACLFRRNVRHDKRRQRP